MDDILARLLGIAVSAGGAAVVKTVSKSKNSTVHEYGAPLAAGVIGAGFEALTGHHMDPAVLLQGALLNGAPATWGHSIYYGLRPKNRKVQK